ncbi:MAG TPA: MFS transporter [Streptosporangiaceae bacterium]|nr:MFS transporter [Streptosporangiaceae bacterium]
MTTTTPKSRRIPPPPAARSTYRSVFAVGEFRVLFATMLMFVLGFEFEILGLSVLVYAQTRSAFWTALAFSMGFAPQVLGGTLFTSLADRLPPRLLISAGLLTRAAPGLVIGLWPALPVPVMLALVAAAATATPVFTAAASAVLPDVLDGDRYVLGRSVFSLTGSATQIIGLGIGGAILAALPARRLLLAAGLALLAAAVVARLGLRPRPARTAGRTTRGIVRATMAGNLELLGDRTVRGLLLAQWLPAWFVTGAESLIVPYAGSLGLPPSAASPLLAATPAGMLLGDLVVGRFCRPAARQRLAFPLAALMGAPLLVLAFRPPLPVTGTVLFACGFGFAYTLGVQQPFLDSLPDRLRGQAFGLNSTGMMTGQGLFPPVAGGLAAAFGAGPAMAVAGAVTILAALLLRGPLTGRVRGHTDLLLPEGSAGKPPR